ncbi:hypothetical protein BJ741DRAFT_251191 [Chytriomyces cf. hyalinus JEL632]|nr:hypothetical protein BJ741DRAFT_251191 [Chytriomyces cf. hyalinus JEL632]
MHELLLLHAWTCLLCWMGSQRRRELTPSPLSSLPSLPSRLYSDASFLSSSSSFKAQDPLISSHPLQDCQSRLIYCVLANMIASEPPPLAVHYIIIIVAVATRQ